MLKISAIPQSTPAVIETTNNPNRVLLSVIDVLVQPKYWENEP